MSRIKITFLLIAAISLGGSMLFYAVHQHPQRVTSQAQLLNSDTAITRQPAQASPASQLAPASSAVSTTHGAVAGKSTTGRSQLITSPDTAARNSREELAESEIKEDADRERDDGEEAESELVLRRNGKTIRVRQEPGERTDQPEEAMQAYLQKRLPTGAEVLPVERYFTARAELKARPQFNSVTNKLVAAPAAAGRDSRNLPNVGLNLWQGLGPGNVGGRTRALIIDPANPNTMYSAGVDGGVWKTTDGGANWAPLDDFMANIAVTSLAFEPGNPSTIYAGTGEGYFNADAVRGAGIFKTINSGTTWTRLPATAGDSNFFFVNDIVVSNVDVQHIYAATGTGVMRSLDGGISWTLVLSVPTIVGSTTGVRGAMDLAIRTDQATDYIFCAAGTTFNAGEPQSHIFRNTDAGGAGTWDDVYTESIMGRTSLAIAPSNQNVIYAMSDQTPVGAGNYSLGLLAVFRSTSSGALGTWTTQVRTTSVNKQDTLLLSNPVNAVFVECGFGASNQFLNQGWYDNVLAVDPSNENIVWAGGVDLFRSDNGGVNWGVASYWWFQGNGTPPNNGDPQLVHADNHVLVFHPNYNGTTNQTLIVGDDGGIYKTDNAKAGNVGYVNGTTPSGGTVTSTSPICGNEFTPGGFFTVPNPVIWGPLNNGYAVTQFYDGVVYPNGTTYFGGTQDNGTNRGTDANGPNAWERILGGDGGYVAVDPANTNVLYAENTGNTFQKSTNGGASFVAARTGISGDTFPFTSVFRMDPNNNARLWYAGRFMWRTDNSAGNWTRTSDAQQTGGSITAIAIATGNSDRVIDGAASGQIRRTTVGTTATGTSVLNATWLQSFTPRGNGFGGISWVEFDPTNQLVVYATVSNFNSAASGNGFGHVFKSTDGGATWALLDGTGANTVPDIPVHCILVVPAAPTHLYIGTDLGVFVSPDGGFNWYKDLGFPDVVTESLALNVVGGVTSIYAFTHGRGVLKESIIPTAAPAAISGAITMADGTPVPGITVSLNGTASLTTITDSNGRYHFDNIATDNFYTVTPSLVNYQFTPANRSFSLSGDKTDAVFTAMPDALASGNAIDANGYFVRQHYLDFLGREPDAGGFAFWTGKLNQCNGDQVCLIATRVETSAAFFKSKEFKDSGSYVYRLYQSALGRQLSYAEFAADRQQVIGGADLDSNKTALALSFVARAEFLEKYQNNTFADSFVDALLRSLRESLAVDLAQQRTFLINRYNSAGGGDAGRAAVLRDLAENSEVADATYIPSFVLMEYFGYLRRGAEPEGYAFWLNVMNNSGADGYRGMVCSFLTATEYQRRFGTVITRSNADCRP